MPFSKSGKLYYEAVGQKKNAAIIFLHGFMGNGREWLPVAQSLSREYYCLLPDLPGHGHTVGLADADYTLSGAAALVREMLQNEGIERADLVGYSMGGRLGWYLAVTYPEIWRSVILENTTPGISDAAERAARRRDDEKLARRLEGGDLQSFVEAWYRLPLWQSLRRHPHLPGLIRERSRNNPHELAKSLRKMGTGSQPDLREHFRRINFSVFLLSGGKDFKFYRIARELREQFPRFQLWEFPEAGHNIHFELPEQFLNCLKQILNKRGDENE